MRMSVSTSPRTSCGCARATTGTPRATCRHGRAWTTFKGSLVHSETWPEDLDLKDKKVVVIGSGATAATIIPAIADDCAHVTMLQRSPTFFITGRNAIDLAETLRQLQVDEAWIHEIVRRKILFDQATFTRRCMRSRTSSARN